MTDLIASNATGSLIGKRSRLSRVQTQRVILVLATLVYTAAFQSTYRDLVAPLQEGWGAGYRSLAWPLLLLIYSVCVLPSFWLPVAFRRPSLLIFYVQYYLVFIPSAFLVFYLVLPQLEMSEATMLLCWMTMGLAVMQATYLFPLARLRRPRIAPKLFWSVIGTIGIGLFGYIVIALHSNFQLVGLSQIYAVRASLGGIVAASGDPFIGYAGLWMDNLGFPLAFAIGMYSRRWWMIAVVLVGYLFVFGVSGQKAALLATVYLPGFYWLLRPRGISAGATVATAFTAVLLLGYPLAVWLPSISNWYISIIHFRTFTIQAINFGQYYAFFKDHPLTYFSHLAGVRWFIHYPYELDIPFTLGYYYYNAPVGNNSGMWASDAIAGAGVWSIPLVSIVAGAVFWVLDSCAAEFDPRFVALVISYIASTFANVSLGTTFVSGGLGLLCLVLLVLPRSGRFAQYYMRADADTNRRHSRGIRLHSMVDLLTS